MDHEKQLASQSCFDVETTTIESSVKSVQLERPPIGDPAAQDHNGMTPFRLLQIS